MLAVPLIASGFAIVRPDDRRAFVMIWLAVVGLLGIVVMLAMVDVLNNIRIHTAERRHMRSQRPIHDDEIRVVLPDRANS
jgi:hypothetical protein